MTTRYIIHFQDGSDDGLRADGIELLNGWVSFYEGDNKDRPVAIYPASAVKAIYQEAWA